MVKYSLISSLTFWLLTSIGAVTAQDGTSYLLPPSIITDMILAEPAPSVNIDDRGQWMVLSRYDGYPPIEELARPELRLAGLRMDPQNFSPSRMRFITSLQLQDMSTGETHSISGLPDPLAASQVSWSPKQSKIAFLHVTRERVDLYIIDPVSRKANKINSSPLNTITGGYQWYDEETLIYRAVVKPAGEAPPRPLAPKGPAIQENYGQASPRPTYQDMLRSPHDEDLFRFYTTTQLIRNTRGQEVLINDPAIYQRISISPDKQYMLVKTIQPPYSYLVPMSGFPSSLVVMDMDGQVVRHLADLPSTETAPSGYDNVQLVPRGHTWREDMAATLVWCHPLDSGLINRASEFRDAVYTWTAPFDDQPKLLCKTTMRYRGITWGNASVALVLEGLTSKQSIQTSLLDPSSGAMTLLQTRNTTDAYSNPGNPVLIPNEFDQDVLFISRDGKLLFNNTTGSSPKGDLPFLMSYELGTKKADTLWRCGPDYFEMIVKVLDPEQLTLVTRRENQTEFPNYWLKHLRRRIADRQLTSFKNPYPQIEGITKEKIRYKRADGVDLTGDLYLPNGYEARRDGPLPVILWAYPREFQSRDDAAQNRGSENRFTMMNWGSPVCYATQGYAVLNNAEMPIVSTGEDKKPNDDFIDQLRLNAEAAIQTLSDLGVGDRDRVAVGGHSYGAFMAANLLAHTDLFKAGIARSGAYNRSLTPFGFQNEDRTYWEAPDVYHEMSPFSYAHRIKAPLLLIHGDADNNTGTYPIQSERMFNAIKGHGGTARFVSLPHESHGYQARESILHTLAEQLHWLDKYVKGATGKS